MADEVKSEDEVLAEAQEILDADAEDALIVRRKTAIIDSIVKCTWPMMRLHDLSSCILGARVAADVLRAHDIRWRAVTTNVRIFNAPLVARMQRGEIPRTVEEIEAWSKVDGSWNVGIGGFGYDKPGHFDGHIVIVAEERVLLDPTLSQANRPEHGIDLDGLAGRVPPGWPDADPTPVQVSENGCAVVYELLTTDRRWAATESWRDRELRQPVVEAISAIVDSALADL